MKKTLIRRGPAFPFFLEALSAIETSVKPMFGCHAVYVGEKIVAILRDREDFLIDNGIWVALEDIHKGSIKELFPELRDLNLFGGGPTLWQNLPKTSGQFESEALRLAALIVRLDPRIGKTPVRKGRMVKRKTAPSILSEEADGKLEAADEEPVKTKSAKVSSTSKSSVKTTARTVQKTRAKKTSKSTARAASASAKSSSQKAVSKSSSKSKSSAKRPAPKSSAR